MREILANYSNFKRGRTSGIKYIVLHYTANNGDTAQNNGMYFKNNNVGASAHYFVDEREVIRSVKDSDTAWHCETRGMAFKNDCRNNNSIGIEMCSRIDKSGKFYILADTLYNAAVLTVSLMKKYNVPIKNVIRHYDVCGKMCPKPLVLDINLWNKFKDMVKKLEVGAMVKDIHISLNGKVKAVKSINLDGYNYVKLRDLEDERIKVSFDAEKGLAVVRCV